MVRLQDEEPHGKPSHRQAIIIQHGLVSIRWVSIRWAASIRCALVGTMTRRTMLRLISRCCFFEPGESTQQIQPLLFPIIFIKDAACFFLVVVVLFLLVVVVVVVVAASLVAAMRKERTAGWKIVAVAIWTTTTRMMGSHPPKIPPGLPWRARRHHAPFVAASRAVAVVA